MDTVVLFKGVGHSCDHGSDPWLYARLAGAVDAEEARSALGIAQDRQFHVRPAADRWPGEPEGPVTEVLLLARCVTAHHTQGEIEERHNQLFSWLYEMGRWEAEEALHANGTISIDVPESIIPMVLHLSPEKGEVGIAMMSQITDALTPFLLEMGAALRDGLIVLPLESVLIETRASMDYTTFIHIDAPNGTILIHELCGEPGERKHHMHFSPGLLEAARAVQVALDDMKAEEIEVLNATIRADPMLVLGAKAFASFLREHDHMM